MICYKDMTFCDYYEDCKYGGECKRASTKEVREDAEKKELPLSIFKEQPECFWDKYATRLAEWDKFGLDTRCHILDYTIPQYGDMPDDPITDWTSRDIQLHLKRYVSRISSNARGHTEAIRDTHKIAHLACILRSKLEAEYANDKLLSDPSAP